MMTKHNGIKINHSPQVLMSIGFWSKWTCWIDFSFETNTLFYCSVDMAIIMSKLAQSSSPGTVSVPKTERVPRIPLPGEFHANHMDHINRLLDKAGVSVSFPCTQPSCAPQQTQPRSQPQRQPKQTRPRKSQRSQVSRHSKTFACGNLWKCTPSCSPKNIYANTNTYYLGPTTSHVQVLLTCGCYMETLSANSYLL